MSRSSTFNISCENDIDTLSIVAENHTLIKDKLSREPQDECFSNHVL